MFGFDPLTIGSLMVLAASGADLCTMPAQAKINVIPKSKKITYDYSKTLSEMQQYAPDTIDPYGFHGISVTQGMMSGAIKMTPRVAVNYRYHHRGNMVCIWYDNISVEIEIDPTIIIAKEVYEDRCMRKAVIDHEMKHIDVDRRLVNKFAKTIGRKIHDALKERGFVTKFPVEPGRVKEVASRMQKTVFQLTEHEYKKLDLERVEAQQAIDNKAEYDRVAALCPHFESKRAAALKGRTRK